MRIRKSEQKVYDFLKSQIDSGLLLPNTKLVEEDVANALGVSRSPVRSAIKLLSEQGDILLIPNKGAFILESKLTHNDYVDKLQVIELLVINYLFQIEAKSLVLPVQEMKENLNQIKGHLNKGETKHGADKVLRFFTLLLVEQRNSYYRKLVLEILQQVLNSEMITEKKSVEKRDTLFLHLERLQEFLEEKKFPHCRREVRILINDLTLMVVDQQDLGQINKYQF